MTDTTDTDPTDPAGTGGGGAAGDALGAAVPGARGWFRASGMAGAINLRSTGALSAAQYDDGRVRLIAMGAQSFELAVGPYDTIADAETVGDELLRLAYDDNSWPAHAAA